MKKLYTIIALFICLTAQAQKVEWVKNIGSSANDQGLRCQVDNSGNFLFSGTFTDSIEFGNGVYLKGNGGIDAYLAKTNALGSIIWAKVFTGQRKGKTVDARGLAIDSEGSIYITGTFIDTLNIEGQMKFGYMESPTTKDIFIAKYSSEGVLTWVNTLTGPGSDMSEDIEVLGNNLVLVGSYTSSLTIGNQSFQSQDPNDPGYNPFVAAFNLNGQSLWVDKIDCKVGFCRALTISVNGKINLLVEAKGAPILRTVGNTYASPLKQSEVLTDDYLIQVNPTDGSMVWSNRMGSPSSEMGYAITSDASNNIFIGGLFQSTVKLESQDGKYQTGTSKGKFDNFICKYNSQGQLKWATFEGNTETEGIRDIAVSSGGYVYVGGYFIDQTKVGDSTFVNPGLTAYLAKYAPEGTFKWAQTATGSSNTSYFTSLSITPNDKILMTGYFNGKGTFLDNTTLPNPHDSTNVWFALLSDLGNSSGILSEPNSISLSVYPIPASNQLNIQVDADQRIQRVRIFNIIGNTILDNSTGDRTIQVCSLRTGIYLLEVLTNKGRAVQRIVISK